VSVLTPGDAFEALLRSSKIPQLDLVNGPYMDEAPEPQPAFPWCVYELTPIRFGLGAEAGLTFEKQFTASYDLKVMVYALQPLIAQLASEYGQVSQSVFAFLDQYMSNPQSIDAIVNDTGVFSVFEWRRQGPVDIKMDKEKRDPTTTARVYKGEATYTISVTADTN
jgi:hypothetical protein